MVLFLFFFHAIIILISSQGKVGHRDRACTVSELSPEERHTIYQDVRQRVHKRFERRKEFFSHLVGYVVSIIGFWLFWNPIAFGDGGWGIAAALATLGWTIGILIHMVQFAFDEWGERAIDAELERVGLTTYQQRKSKRAEDQEDERLMRLGEDGELVEMQDDYQEDHFYKEAK